MPEQPKIILSALADEAALQKTAEQQFAALAALGLQYYTVRFIDAGQGVKNVMQLTKGEIAHIRHLEDAYGMNVTSIGSPIGKVKLVDVDDGTKNRYVPFKKYLKEVQQACDIAHAFETKLIRGFSFYHPKGSSVADHMQQAVDQLGQIAETCHRSDLTYGLEVEANLVGHSGQTCADLHKQVNHPALMLIYDGANIVTQGYNASECFEQYELMKKGLGWMHIKDYRNPPGTQKTTHVDEEALKHFVPCDIGDTGHEMILRDFKEHIPKLEAKLKRRGIPGVFLDLEPHVRGGGQFGGFSGPDGLGVALRALCKVLDYVGIGYNLTSYDDIVASRGL